MRLQARAAAASWLDARSIVDGGWIPAPDRSDVGRVCLALESRMRAESEQMRALERNPE